MNVTDIKALQSNDPGHEERFDYDANSNVIYQGIAQLNTLTSVPGWVLFAFTYDGSQRITRIRTSQPGQIWDNRASILP